MTRGDLIKATVFRGDLRSVRMSAPRELGKYMVQHALDRGYAVVGVCLQLFLPDETYQA